MTVYRTGSYRRLRQEPGGPPVPVVAGRASRRAFRQRRRTEDVTDGQCEIVRNAREDETPGAVRTSDLPVLAVRAPSWGGRHPESIARQIEHTDRRDARR